MIFLVIRFSSLGDVLLTTSILRILKEEYPQCFIYYVVKKEFLSVLEYNNHIHHIFPYEGQAMDTFSKGIQHTIYQQTQKKKIDYIIDLHNNLRSKKCVFYLRYRSKIKYKKPYLKRWMLVYLKKNWYHNKPLSITQQYLFSIQPILKRINQEDLFPEIHREKPLSLMQNLSGKVIVSIAPGAIWHTKTWPLNSFIVVAKFLLQNIPNIHIVILGGHKEENIKLTLHKELVIPYKNKVSNGISQLSLHETAYVISISRLFITNDSGLMHIGSAFNTSMIALFLSTVPEFGFAPMNKNAHIISEDLPCKPCDHKGLSACPKKHFHCAWHISPDLVIEKAMKLLWIRNKTS